MEHTEKKTFYTAWKVKVAAAKLPVLVIIHRIMVTIATFLIFEFNQLVWKTSG